MVMSKSVRLYLSGSTSSIGNAMSVEPSNAQFIQDVPGEIGTSDYSARNFELDNSGTSTGERIV